MTGQRYQKHINRMVLLCMMPIMFQQPTLVSNTPNFSQWANKISILIKRDQYEIDNTVKCHNNIHFTKYTTLLLIIN